MPVEYLLERGRIGDRRPEALNVIGHPMTLPHGFHRSDDTSFESNP